MSIRVLLVDDHEPIRAALRSLCAADHLEVVGEAPDGQTALRLTAELVPDVVVMDVRLPDRSGLDVTRELRAASPRTQVVALTAHLDDTLLSAARAAGAARLVAKDRAFEELCRAVRLAAGAARTPTR